MELQQVICKACGYVMDARKLQSCCPACGVAAKMFEPHVDKVSLKRRTLLALDLHPVMVHFPQAFTATVLVLSVALLFAPSVLRAPMEGTLVVLGVSLPFTVLMAFVAGAFDAKVRFRKLKAPLLRKKMALGALFFLLTSALAILVISGYLKNDIALMKVAILSALAMGNAAWLGLAGTSLLNAKFPG